MSLIKVVIRFIGFNIRRDLTVMGPLLISSSLSSLRNVVLFWGAFPLILMWLACLLNFLFTSLC
jgi:hypothetical protein